MPGPVLEPLVLLANQLEVGQRSVSHRADAQQDVVARPELVREPADAGQLLAGLRFVAGHDSKSAAELNAAGDRGA